MVRLSLLNSNGDVHDGHGVNWYNARVTGSHTSAYDACIPIKVGEIRSTNIIPEKSVCEGVIYRVIFDDYREMDILFEGTQTISGVDYPKQISSTPHKNELGLYLRERLEVENDHFITLDDLEEYGRTNITLSLINGQYRLDFS